MFWLKKTKPKATQNKTKKKKEKLIAIVFMGYTALEAKKAHITLGCMSVQPVGTENHPSTSLVSPLMGYMWRAVSSSGLTSTSKSWVCWNETRAGHQLSGGQSTELSRGDSKSWLFSLKRRNQRGNLIAVCNYLSRGYQGDGLRLLLELHCSRKRESRHKPEREKFQLDFLFFKYKNIFSERQCVLPWRYSNLKWTTSGAWIRQPPMLFCDSVLL